MNDQNDPGLLSALWRYRWMSAVIVVITMIASVGLTLLLAPAAEASATVALATPRPNGVLSPGTSGDASLTRYTAQRARFVTSDAVIAAVAETTGRTDLSRLRREITATPSGNANIITITARGDSAEEAAALAGATVDAYRTVTRQEVQRLTDAAIASIDETAQELLNATGPGSPAIDSAHAATLSQLQLQAAELRTSSALFGDDGDGVEWVVAPRADAAGSRDLPLREALLGLVVGLAIAATVAWLRADRQRTLTKAREPEAVLAAPLLAQVRSIAHSRLDRPADLKVLPWQDYRLLWAALLRRTPSGAVLVAGVGDASRSVASLNLAAAAAREGLSVLIVDADLSGAELSTLIGQRAREGVADLLSSRDGWRASLHQVQVDADHAFAVIPAGRLNGRRIDLSIHRIEQSVQEWREAYDLVLIDADPVESDAGAMLCGAADGVLVMVGKGAHEDEAQELVRAVELQNTEMIGYAFVIPDAPKPRSRPRAALPTAAVSR